MRIKASVVRGRSSCYWDWARFAAAVVVVAAAADVDCDDYGVSHCLGVVVYSRLTINSNDTFDFAKVSLFAAVVDDALDFDLSALVDCYSCRLEEDYYYYCIVDRIKANMTMLCPLRATVLRESMWAKVAEATDYN